MADRKVIGKRLRELRGDIPREIICADVGISYSALSMYEAGERVPRDEIKVALARRYNTSIESIFYAE